MASRLPALGPRGEGWVVIQIVLFGAIGASGILALANSPGAGTGPARLIGAVAIVAGGLVVLSAAWALRASLTPFPRPTTEAELVESGAFRWVRHPIYSGIVLAAVGWAVAAGSVLTLVLAGLLLVLFDAKSRREEAWLEQAFPGYPAYRERTRRFIPGLY